MYIIYDCFYVFFDAGNGLKESCCGIVTVFYQFCGVAGRQGDTQVIGAYQQDYDSRLMFQSCIV